MTGVRVAGRVIGAGHPCFLIAEAGVNHNGDAALAHRLVEVAAECGADAVKFQTFRADDLVTPNAPKAAYQQAGGDDAESQLEMLRRLELPDEEFARLRRHCDELGLVFLSTPFGEASADLLDALDVAAYKLPSGELTNVPFLRHVAIKGRPIVLSTGMATLEEVSVAVGAIRDAGNEQLVLLHCVSCYPSAPGDANLRAMATMAEAFGVPVGWSDHMPGTEVALAAVGLGAAVLEKHFTTDRDLPGPDHRASLEPEELAAMIAAVRSVESALGDGVKQPVACEDAIAAVARKSLVAARSLAPGDVMEWGDIVVRRPGTGLPPSALDEFVGRTVARAVPAGALLSLDDLS